MRRVRFEPTDLEGEPLASPVQLRVLVTDDQEVEEHQLTDVLDGADLLLGSHAVVRAVRVLDPGGTPLTAEGPSDRELASAPLVRLRVQLPTPGPATTRVLEVRVVDEQGVAIGGASVESQGGREVLTDDRGTARVTVPAAETTELTARLHDSRTTASVSAYDSAPEVVLRGLEPVPAQDSTPPPRLPSPEGYAGSERFSSDVADSADAFLAPDRSVEESTSLVVVRLEEPALAPGLSAPPLRGVPVAGGTATALPPDRGEEAARPVGADEPTSDPARHPSAPIVVGVLAPGNPLAGPTGTRAPLAPFRSPLPPSSESLLRKEAQEHRDDAFGLMAAQVGAVARRRVLPTDPIRWDLPAGRREAATVTRGHLVRLRQVWRADGYSFGRLLHSLPLAPGQSKRIAVVDWRREETGSRSDQTRASDELEAEVDRSRSVTEDMSSVLRERLTGSSESFTVGGGAGLGVGATGVQGGTGIAGSGGAAGGVGYATAKADQTSMKDLTAAMQQDVRDRTAQAARSVREQRTTVVRTVSQNESSSAVTEAVSNHNRNHAMTVLYFEVLRHLVVSTELAEVTPCLLVPLPTVGFNAATALQHRDVLAPLVDPGVLDGFDACERLLGRTAAPDHTLRELRATFELDMPRVAGEEVGVKDRFRSAEDPPYAAVRLRLLTDRSAGGWSDAAVVTEPTGVDRWRVEAATVGVPALALEDLIGVEIELFERDDSARGPASVHDLEVTGSTRASAHALARLSGRAPVRSGRLRVSVRTPPSPPRSGEDAVAAARLLAHLDGHRIRFHKAIWARLDRDELFAMLDERLAPGSGPTGRSLASVLRPEPVGFIGNSLVLPMVHGVRLRESDPDAEELRARYATESVEQRVTLPTGGVFAEAVLGTHEAAEVIDDSRFWKWDEHPLEAAPDLAPVSTDSRHQAMDLDAGPLATPVIGMQQPGSLPDPQSLAAGLAAIASGSTFRDVTGIDKVTQNSIDALRQAVQSAQALGEKAGENATKAFTAHTEAQTERYRADATQRDLASLEQARNSKLVSPQVAERIAEGILTGRRAPAEQGPASPAAGPGTTEPGATEPGTPDPGTHAPGRSTTPAPTSTPSRRPSSVTHRPAPPAASDVAGVDQAAYVGTPCHVLADLLVLATASPLIGSDSTSEIGRVRLAMEVVRSRAGVVYPLRSTVRTSVARPWNRVLTIGTAWSSRSVRHEGAGGSRLLSDLTFQLALGASERTDGGSYSPSISWGIPGGPEIEVGGSYEHSRGLSEQPRAEASASFEVKLVGELLAVHWGPWTHVAPGAVVVPATELPTGLSPTSGRRTIFTDRSLRSL